MDEARVGQQGTLTRVWARLAKGSVRRSRMEWQGEGPRGTRPRALRNHRRNSVYLSGAVCPERGIGAAVVLPHVNVDAMNIHLAEISRSVTHGAHAVLVLDQAGWHTSPKLHVPENISLLPLPAYAPELNPVEQVWAYLRANFLSHRVWNSCGAIVDACCAAWNTLMTHPSASPQSRIEPGPKQSPDRAFGITSPSKPRIHPRPENKRENSQLAAIPFI